MEMASYEAWLPTIRLLAVLFVPFILKFNFNLKWGEEEKHLFCSSDMDVLVYKFWIDDFFFLLAQ